MEMSITGITKITNGVLETSMVGLCLLLLIICAVLGSTAGKKWKIIRKQEKRIKQLEKRLKKK